MKKLLLIAAILTCAAIAQADLLISYDFATYLGTEVEGTSAVSGVVGMASPAYITRGAGVTPTANGGRFNANGWDAYTDTASALAGGNYFEFTVSPDVSYSLNVTSVFFQIQRSNTGASNYVLRSSADSYVSDLGSTIGAAGNNATVGTTVNTSLSGGSITFRVIAYGGTTTGSTGFEGTGDEIAIYGTVAAIPEPTTMALLGAGALMAYGFWRRKKV